MGHTITKEGRSCSDCHESEALRQYKETGQINAVWWDPDSAKLVNLTGVIPVPSDYQNALKFSYVRCVSGCDNPQTAQWEHLKDHTDLWQMLFAEPLTPAQIQKLIENP